MLMFRTWDIGKAKQVKKHVPCVLGMEAVIIPLLQITIHKTSWEMIILGLSNTQVAPVPNQNKFSDKQETRVSEIINHH